MSEPEVLNGQRRQQLEHQAEAVRSRLERRLDELDERREHLVSLAKKASRPPVSVALLGTAAVVGAAVVIHQVRRRPNRRQRIGSGLFGVPLQKPEGFLMRAFKQAALSLVATLVHRVGTRGLDRVLPEPEPSQLPDQPQLTAE